MTKTLKNYFFIFCALIFVLRAEPVFAKPIELICETHLYSCSEDKCNQDYSLLKFKLKNLFGAKVNTHTVYIDEDKKDARLDSRYYHLNSVLPNSIKISFSLDKTVLTDIFINRMSGQIWIRDIHTDGSIKELPVGSPYIEDYGYCTDASKRKF